MVGVVCEVGGGGARSAARRGGVSGDGGERGLCLSSDGGRRRFAAGGDGGDDGDAGHVGDGEQQEVLMQAGIGSESKAWSSMGGSQRAKRKREAKGGRSGAEWEGEEKEQAKRKLA